MLDKYFWKKENKIKRNYDIEDHLFEKMKGATQVYDASVADIFNACIMELIESQDIELSKVMEAALLLNQFFTLKKPFSHEKGFLFLYFA